MQVKTDLEIKSEEMKNEDEITMFEMKRIADTLMVNIETEYDCPSLHPELGHKVPVLDLAVWVEEVDVTSRGLDDQNLHHYCCRNENLEQLTSLDTNSLTHPQHNGGLRQVFQLIITHQIPNSLPH